MARMFAGTCSACRQRKRVFKSRRELALDFPQMCGACYGLYVKDCLPYEPVWAPRPEDWTLLRQVFIDIEWEPEFRKKILAQARIEHWKY
jgi:hypothetical protein